MVPEDRQKDRVMEWGGGPGGGSKMSRDTASGKQKVYVGPCTAEPESSAVGPTKQPE